MRNQRNPNSWSCLPTAFANALNMDVELLINALGHDGSEYTHAGLPEPLCRRGFHPQELIKACLKHYSLSVTRVELFPSATPNPALNRPVKHFDIGGTDWFFENMFETNGVIECRTGVGTGHAMSYEGAVKSAWVYDPANNKPPFELRNLTDAECRDRYMFALWRLDEMA